MRMLLQALKLLHSEESLRVSAIRDPFEIRS